jgi:hypothetical protein
VSTRPTFVCQLSLHKFAASINFFVLAWLWSETPCNRGREQRCMGASPNLGRPHSARTSPTLRCRFLIRLCIKDDQGLSRFPTYQLPHSHPNSRPDSCTNHQTRHNTQHVYQRVAYKALCCQAPNRNRFCHRTCQNVLLINVKHSPNFLIIPKTATAKPHLP